MHDEGWRAQERMWLADPGDQDALARAIAARRRAGLPVPAFMLEKRVHAAGRFESRHGLDVFALLPDGSVRGLGRTPVAGGLEVPEHRALWVQPEMPTDAGLRALAEDADAARQVAGLSLGPDVTDAGLAALEAFGGITRLDLAGCTRITARGLEHVGRMWGLEALDLWSALKVDDDALAHLAGLSQLVTLNLRKCAKLTARGVAHLAGLEALAVLSLGGCTKVADAALLHLARLPQLTALDLSSCPIGDAGLACLGGLSELTILNLSWTKVTAAGLEQLASLDKLVQLYVLGCPATGAAEKVLRSRLPRCEVVAATSGRRSRRAE
jgi:hypothetical protein